MTDPFLPYPYEVVVQTRQAVEPYTLGFNPYIVLSELVAIEDALLYSQYQRISPALFGHIVWDVGPFDNDPCLQKLFDD